MAQTLVEIRQSVQLLVGERERDVQTLKVRLKSAKKELREAKSALTKLGGAVAVLSNGAAPVKKVTADESESARGRVLAHLRNNGGTRPGELKDVVGCGPWTFERWRALLDRLKDENLIEVRGQTTATKIHLKVQ